MIYAGITVIAGFQNGFANPVYFTIDTDPSKKIFEVVEFIDIYKGFRDDCIVTTYVCRLKEPNIEVTMILYVHKNDGFWWAIDSHEKQLV